MPGEMTRADLARAALIAVVCTLPLGATPLEVGNGVGVVVAIGLLATGGPLVVSPFAGPALAIAVAWLAFAGDARFDAWDAIRRVWALSPLFSVPVLLAEAGDDAPIVRAGLAVAAATALLPIGQALLTPEAAWSAPTGLFAHHLTLAYALIAPLAVASARREPLFAVPIAAAIASTGAIGPALAAITVVAAVFAGGRRAMSLVGVGALGAAAIGMFAPRFVDDLARRAILWTAGADLAVAGGVPAGAWRAEVAPVHRIWAPGFEFPHHAHDNLIQLAGDAGPGAWVAVGLAAAIVWERGTPVLIALALALLVGGLTQDLFGDIEVIRAVLVWTALVGTAQAAEGRS